MTERFFEERQEQSEAKARIVSKYFSAWARVIMPSAQRNGGKIAYIDLYAGPGRYKDGAASTPLLVLQTAINHLSLPFIPSCLPTTARLSGTDIILSQWIL